MLNFGGRAPRLTHLASVLAIVLLTALPHLGHAAGPYDPALTYRTVHNHRFAVHYPPGAYNLAVRVMRRAEHLLVQDATLLGNMPQGIIDIVLTDTQDDANGSAQVVPKNILRLYLAAPTELTGLAFYDDWLDILLTHELAHLVDIDHTRGFTRFLRSLFGHSVAYNGSTPQFLSEGVAVYAETKLTQTGRGRSSYVEMLLRNAALAQTFPSIDQANILYAEFPYGNVAYFFGGRFHLYLSERFGENAVAKLHAYYASQLVPLIYGPGAYSLLGHSLPELWYDFARAERSYAYEVLADVQNHGITPSHALTHHGRDITGARYSPDSQSVVYSRRSPVDGPTVRWLHRESQKDTFLALDTFSHRFTFDKDGRGFIYSQASITHRFDSFGELYYFDIKANARRALRNVAHPKQSLRARDPALSADGERLAFVQTALQQSFVSVARIERDQHNQPRGLHTVSYLLPPQGEVQYASPAFSPDGKLLAVSVWLPGGLRDIHIVDANSGALVTRLTQDTAQDGNPCWSPDGAYVLYESDADGISNLYAYHVADGTYSRITYVVGGAFQPDVSPDGKHILYRSGTARGFDLHELPYAPQAWQPVTYSPKTGYVAMAEGAGQPVSQAWAKTPMLPALPRVSEPALPVDSNAGEHEGPYHPLRTLVPGPNNWLLVPNAYLINNSPGVSLTTFGQDVLATQTWSAQLGYTARAAVPDVTLAYANDQWLPTFTLSLAQTSAPYATNRGYAVEADTSVNAGVSWPLANRHRFGLGYTFEHRRGNRLAQNLLPLGRFAALQLVYNYRFARMFTYGISPEHGRSAAFSALYYSPHLGSAREELLLSGDVRAYINNPLFDNHVLALRLTVNYAVGPDRVQNFFMYGSQGASILTVQSSRLFGLRGFLPSRGPYGSPLSGTGLLAGYGEYRLPLWHIQRGIGTWPIFFEHLHVALFADAGNTFGTLSAGNGRFASRSLGWAMAHMWLGTGAEVRLDVAVAWVYPITLRAGIAQGVLAAGQRVIDSATPLVYFDVGTTL